jgi:hypothetical protein
LNACLDRLCICEWQIDLVELEAPVLFAQADAASRTEAAEIGVMLKRIPSSEQAAEQLLDCPPEFAMGVSSATAEQGLLEAAVFRPALHVQQTIGSKSTHRVLTGIFDHPQPVASPAQCAEFEDWGVRIDQQFDTFAGGHLAAGVMAFNVFRSAARQRLGKFSVEFDQLGRHRRGGVEIRRRRWVDGGAQRGHA